MKYIFSFSILMCLILGGVYQTGAFAQSNAKSGVSAKPSVNAQAARGSLSPAAPVKLDYSIAEAVAPNQQNSVAIEITTRLNQGSLLVEVAKQQGVTLLCDTQRRFDLGNTTQPIKFALPVLLGEQAERYLIVLLTVDTPMGPMSRSFRIDLSTPNESEASPPIPQ